MKNLIALHLFATIFFSNFTYSSQDECVLLKKKLNENLKIYSLSENPSFQANNLNILPNSDGWNNYKSGIFFKKNFEDLNFSENIRPYFRNAKNNLILNSIAPILTFRSDIAHQDLRKAEVIFINKEQVNLLNDEDIKALVESNSDSSEKTIDLQLKKSDGQVANISLDINRNYPNEIPIELFVNYIRDIDTLSSSFEINYLEKYYYWQFGLDEIGNSVYEEVFGQDSDFQFRSDGFHCKFDPSEIDNINLWTPNLTIPNLISEKVFHDELIFWFNKFEDESYSYWERRKLKTSKLKLDFDYKSFPFDSQIIEIKYETYGEFDSYPSIINDIPIRDSFSKISLSEWNPVMYSYKQYNHIFQETMSEDEVGLSVKFLLERNYIYYLSKIYLPIIIILLVSLSVLYIDPKQIESRLTVSVVCFLALIAYTYVVDRDLPRLSYLTVMDQIILLSYFFSAMPTLQSIFIYGVAIDDYQKAIYQNKSTRFWIPLIYFAAVIFFVLTTISGSDNTISALKFTNETYQSFLD